MKLVTVVIKPFKLEDVREALSSMGIQGLTVTEVKGFGRQKGHAELYRGAEYSVNFLPKVKIDVAIADDQLDEVVDVISKAAYTGKIGDGKIFVAELQRVIRIRTGESDEAANWLFRLKPHHFSARYVTFLHHLRPRDRDCLIMVHQAISDSSCVLAASSSPTSCS